MHHRLHSFFHCITSVSIFHLGFVFILYIHITILANVFLDSLYLNYILAYTITGPARIPQIPTMKIMRIASQVMTVYIRQQRGRRQLSRVFICAVTRRINVVEAIAKLSPGVHITTARSGTFRSEPTLSLSSGGQCDHGQSQPSPHG